MELLLQWAATILLIILVSASSRSQKWPNPSARESPKQVWTMFQKRCLCTEMKMYSVLDPNNIKQSILMGKPTFIKACLVTWTHWLLAPIPLFWKHKNIYYPRSSDCVSAAICQSIYISFNAHNNVRDTDCSFTDKEIEPQGYFKIYLESQLGRG